MSSAPSAPDEPLVRPCAPAAAAAAGWRVSLQLHPYPLQLRTAFGTSHSSSTQRNNALLRICISGADGSSAAESSVTGVGEAGMPPRKTGCYELTYAALCAHVDAWGGAIESAQLQEMNAGQKLYDPFVSCPPDCYTLLRAELAAGAVSHPLLPGLLHAFRALDAYLSGKKKEPTDAAFLCVAEAAIMDAWGQIRKQQLCQMIGTEFDAASPTSDAAAASSAPAAAVAAASSTSASPAAALPPSPRQPRSFYTLGMDSLETMVANLRWGLDYTPLIKIKCDADLARTKAVLEQVVPLMLARAPAAAKVSIDANSAWSTPAVAFEFLEVLRPYAAHVAMVEQPFPLFRATPQYVVEAYPDCGLTKGQRAQVVEGRYVALDDSVVEGWASVARAYEQAGLPIYADESICNLDDIRAFRSLLHGVNIKLEKAGGYRAALGMLDAARDMGVSTWLGSMVGSSLSSSQAAHLLPKALPHCWGDLDGSLLTLESSDAFTGGMQWRRDDTGEIGMEKAAYGTACILKKSAPQQLQQ